MCHKASTLNPGAGTSDSQNAYHLPGLQQQGGLGEPGSDIYNFSRRGQILPYKGCFPNEEDTNAGQEERQMP